MSQKKINLAPPKTLILMITNKCNLKCTHCVTLKDFPDLLNTRYKKLCLQQFKKLNPDGEVWLSGGEPLLKTKEVLALIKTAKALNLSAGLTTNSIFIKNIAQAEQLIKSGLSFITISLESHRREINDLIRGAGTYDRILQSVRLLQAVRIKHKIRFPVITLTLTILDLNFSEILEFINLAKSLKVDGVFLQTLVGNNKHWPRSQEALQTALQNLYTKIKNDPFVVNRNNLPFYIENCKSPLFTEQELCSAFRQSIYIDTMGNFRLCCFSQSIGSVKKTPLIDLWNSPLAEEVRFALSGCLLRCGLFQHSAVNTGIKFKAE